MKHTGLGGRDDSHSDLPKDAAELRDRLYELLRKLDHFTDEPGERSGPPTVERILAILKARRRREQRFDPELFADPAWDMLLELYAAELSNRRMSVSSLCIGAAVPATTALRWMKSLESKRLIQRARDPRDGRRVFVSLTPDAIAAMDAVLRACPLGENLL